MALSLSNAPFRISGKSKVFCRSTTALRLSSSTSLFNSSSRRIRLPRLSLSLSLTARDSMIFPIMGCSDDERRTNSSRLPPIIGSTFAQTMLRSLKQHLAFLPLALRKRARAESCTARRSISIPWRLFSMIAPGISSALTTEGFSGQPGCPALSSSSLYIS